MFLLDLSYPTWFEENFGTEGNNLALELFSMKFAPCAHLIIVWFNVEEMTHTSDCISPGGILASNMYVVVATSRN